MDPKIQRWLEKKLCLNEPLIILMFSFVIEPTRCTQECNISSTSRSRRLKGPWEGKKKEETKKKEATKEDGFVFVLLVISNIFSFTFVLIY
jgi:hypothetical protein